MCMREAWDTMPQTREDRVERCDANNLHGVILCFQVDDKICQAVNKMVLINFNLTYFVNLGKWYVS